MSSPYTRPQISSTGNEPETVRTIQVERYERCEFCNSKLIFTHDLNLGYLEVIETGRCPGCGVSLSPKKYTLQ